MIMGMFGSAGTVYVYIACPVSFVCVVGGERDEVSFLVQVDAVTYYDNEVQAATLALDAERVHALEKGLGTSFVTFSSPTGASE